MTLYDILVPAFALAFGALAVLVVRLTDPDRKQSKHR
jgi:hypothetical protein